MSTINPIDEAFQYVPVPQRHVPAVYRLLADIAASDAAVALEGEATDDIPNGPWTAEKLARFAAGDTKTTEIGGEIMDILAGEDSESPLTIDDLAERTGRPRSQIKALWTHLARHLGKHYGTSHPPLSTVWGSDLTPPRENVVYYYLTPEQSEAWKTARAA